MRRTGIIKAVLIMAGITLLASCGSSNNDTINPPPVNTKSNVKPIAYISPATEQSIFVGNTINFSGESSSDPDSSETLKYTWTFDGAATSIQTSTEAIPGPVTFTEKGMVTVNLVVTDSLGLASEPASITVIVDTVGVNKVPIGFISHDNGSGTAGSTGDISLTTGGQVVFTGSAIDPEGDSVTYAWTLPADVTITAGAGTATDTSLTASFPVAGSYLISLTVTDSNGNADPTPAQVKVTVTDAPINLPPNGSISHDKGNGTPNSTGDLSITTGGQVVFAGSAIDPEGDSVTYAWTLPTDVTITAGTATDTSLTASFPVAGSYLISLTVTDSNGNADPTPAQVKVTVTDAPINLPPNGLISHDKGNGTPNSTGDISIVSGTNIVFNGAATDPDGDPVTYAWVFDGATPATATGSGPLTVRYTTPGTFNVKLTVTDNKGNVDPTPAELMVTVTYPEFQYLPVLSDADGNSTDAKATYNLTVDENVPVTVVTPNGTWTTHMMRYNGLQLPPVIKAKRGTAITIKVQNNLAVTTTVHWHGFKVPGDQDGGPNVPIVAGADHTYQFTLVQPAAPLWFHPHANGSTATQVYYGLSGAFVVTDDITDQLESNHQLPAGEYDIPLLIQDRLFATNTVNGERALVYQAAGGMMGMAGMLGDRVLVNGVQMPDLKVESRQYRFRLFNGSNARTYDFALSNSAIFTVIGTDGGLLNKPVVTDHIMLAAGERAEIVVDFGDNTLYPAGGNVMLISRPFTASAMGAGGGTLPNGAAFNVMDFDVIAATTPDNVQLYSALPNGADIIPHLQATDGAVSRDFVMSMAMGMGGGGMRFLINNTAYAPGFVNETVTTGASGITEIWNISNTSGMAHPFHAHAIQWQILDRRNLPTTAIPNPVPLPASGVDLGWKDTILVQPNEMVRIIGHFDPTVNVGMYMYHCHILEHEEAGMMGMFEIINDASTTTP